MVGDHKYNESAVQLGSYGYRMG